MPLAETLRPEDLKDIVGQEHLFGRNGLVTKIINKNYIPSMIFYGPPGTGKTTAASIIAKLGKKRFYKLNATTDSLKDIKDILNELNTLMGYNGLLLYIDEIHHFTKRTQQILLEYVERGDVTLIASTTENPHFYIFKALLSRTFIFEFNKVNDFSIINGLKNIFQKLKINKMYKDIIYDEKALEIIASSSDGDMRKAINFLEMAINLNDLHKDIIHIDSDTLKSIPIFKSINFDSNGDSHYDILSAFQKSIRGSDADAALVYLALLIKGGDLTSICRRLLVIACEDIGLAYPNAITIVKACVDSALMVGFPEAKIILSQAVILLATSPKSNSSVKAISDAMKDIENKNIGEIPIYLKDSHYSLAEKLGRVGYKYPHSYENNYIKQEYMPCNLKGKKYYEYGNNKNESIAKDYWDKIKK